MNNFWHTVDELKPPIKELVWTTSNPFRKVPVIRGDSWDGTRWRHNGLKKNIYWGMPINREKDEL